MHKKVKAYLDSVVIIDGVKTIIGDVNVSGLGLTGLDFHDIHITGHCYCNNNQLISLEGAPSSIGGNFHCYNNQLISLDHLPFNIKRLYLDNKQKPLLNSPIGMLLVLAGIPILYINICTTK